MQCPNPSRLRQPIVLPIHPVSEGIREISVQCDDDSQRHQSEEYRADSYARRRGFDRVLSHLCAPGPHLDKKIVLS